MLFSYVGPVPRFVVSEWLVLAAVLPLIALLHAAWIGLSADEKDVAPRLKRTGLGALAIAGAITIWQAAELSEARYVLQNVVRLARIGQFDVALELLLDPASAALVLVVLGAGAAMLHVTKLAPRHAVTIHLATSGGVIAVLADDAIAASIGIGMVAAASAIVAGRAVGTGRIADLFLVAAIALVFWSLGGRRSEGHFIGDLSPRVIAVSSARPHVDEEGAPIRVDASGKVEERPKAGIPSRTETAFLSVDALPGSWVYVDDSHTPFAVKGQTLRTPFSRVPMPAGVHAVRVHPAQGLDDYLTPQIFFEAEREVRLAVLGPTLVYRLANAQVDYEVPRGATPKRDDTWLVAGLVLLALSVLLRVRDASDAVTIAASLACGMVLVRFAPLVHGSGAWIVAIVGAIASAASALSAARETDRAAAMRDLATAAMGTAVCASAVGSGAAAAASLVLGASSIAVLSLAPRERNASLVAAAALSGAPVPIVGAGWVLAGTYAPAFSGSPALAILLVVLGAASAFATSVAAWRFHEAEKKKRKDVPFVVLAALGALFATALAYSPRVVGGETDGPLASYIAPSAIVVGTPAFACALVLAGAAMAGQRRKQKTLGPSVLGLEPLQRAWRLGAAAVEAASGIARAIETHVIRFATSAIGGLAFAGGWLAVEVEDAAPRPGARIAGAASRIRPTARRVAVFAAIVLAILLGASFARASGRASLHTEDGRRGPVELVESDGVYRGRFVVENTGSSPLSISRVALREDDAVRAARGLAVKVEDGGTSATIAPQTSKRIEIEWKPEPVTGPSQVAAQIVLTTTDEEAGEIAMGVRAQLPGPLGPFEGHLLSLVILLPLIGALAALAIALIFPQGNARIMRVVALACSFAQLALVVVVVRRFVPDFNRLSGNDGLQLVERASWIRPLGVEWYLGLDGASLLALVLVALLGTLGIAVSRAEKEVEGQLGTHLLAFSAAAGACVARDLVLFILFVGIAAIAGAIAVGAFGTKPEARRASGTMAAFAIGSLVALVVCALALRHGSTRTFLGDGSTTIHTFAMPELERVAFTRGSGTIAGVPLVEVAFVAGLLGFGMLAGMFPLHAWITDAASSSSSSLVASVVVPRLGMIGLVRVLAQILPEATRWAGGALVALGAITIVHAGACLVAERDLAKIAARFSIAQTGFVLVGIGSATPQGLAGASAVIAAGGVAVAHVLLVASAVDARIGTSDVSELGGLVHETPLLAVVGMAGLFGAAALPGTAPFWGSLLAVVGAAPAHPALALVAVVGAGMAAAGAFRAVARAFFGTVPEHWRRSPELEPFGGKFPDLRTPEAWAAGTLAVLVVVLGVWPAPMLDVLAGFVRDAVARANLGPLQLGF